jgi:cytidylate kinase
MRREKGLVIAIDGPAASGKSTTARLVAKELGYTYLETGAMYRAVTLRALQQGIDPGDEEGITSLARSVEISFQPDSKGGYRTFLGGVDVSEQIRFPEVVANVSQVSSWRGVRDAMVAAQRAIAGGGAYVLDGRDIGTVVFPDAELKIFLVATIEERARRRLNDLKESGITSELESVAGDLQTRDRKDSTRSESPLRPAEDAIHIDTSGLTIAEQVAHVAELARSIEQSQERPGSIRTGLQE